MNHSETFIGRAKAVHGCKYEYFNTDYINSKTKISIICKKHGEFEQIPSQHLRGSGCKLCAKDVIYSKTRYSTDDFLEKAKSIHGNRYDYANTRYFNTKTKIKIICKVHGEFEQIPNQHLSGYGCQQCTKFPKHTTDSFIAKAIKTHGNKYDYSKSIYVKYDAKIKIVCKEHGEFMQEPTAHMSGHGCPLCKGCNDLQSWIIKVNKIHNYKYDYSKSEYNGSLNKIKIICPVHGEFEQVASYHLRGGCSACGGSHEHASKEFIGRANAIHDNRYDYSKAEYDRSMSKVKILCPIHGEFEQTPNRHVSGQCGCPKCPSMISDAHQELINFIKNSKIINDRDILKPYELDIYIADKNIAIEFHGIYYHSYNRQESHKEKFKHHNKASMCLDKGIQVLQIFEDEWKNKKEIVKSIINSKLGTNNRIFARKCEIKELSSKEFDEFCNKNHIQGKLSSSIRLGLIYDSKLVCVIGFNRHIKYDYECTRFCNVLNTNVIGGAGKLFKYFTNKYAPNSVLSFADRRYSNGGLYKQLGFELSSITNPNYFYIKGYRRFSRQQFQKHKLEGKLPIFDNKHTETSNMFSNGYRRIWDAGHWKFIWNSNLIK